MDVEQAVVFHIQRLSIHDGPGVRTAVFFKGCPLRCAWCHNPESISPAPQLLTDFDRCIGCGRCLSVCPRGAHRAEEDRFDRGRCTGCGACAAVCPNRALELCGQTVTLEGLMQDLLRDRAYFDRSGGGVTFTGGEPFVQAVFLQRALRRCREAGVHTAVESALSVPFDRIAPCLNDIELFLADYKLPDDERHRRYTGVGNERVCENLRLLCARHPRVRLRTPLIPGVNDDEATLEQMASFVRSLPGEPEWELLRFNNLAAGKYRRLGLRCAFSGVEPQSPERVTALQQRFGALRRETTSG